MVTMVHIRSAVVFCCLAACISTAPKAATMTVNTALERQEMDGFGFFGPMQVWWNSSNASSFWTPQWLNLVVDTLGLTIWRNEYYSEEPSQDANWAKQRPFVVALKAKADASNVKIKFIYTVWTPPSQWKSNTSLKNGGTLLPQYYSDYAKWLVEGVKKYQAAGVELYGLSPQNEPLFEEPYNSCVYTKTTYHDMFKAVGPIVHDSCPNVKIFGPEHMLFGIGKDWDYSNIDPSKAIFDDPLTKSQMGFWASHGYGPDGQTPGASSDEAAYWKNAWTRVGQTNGFKLWMTETSGYGNTWDNALDYIMSIHAALFYGHLSGWVHWYGAGDLVTNTALTTKGTMLKHYARFVRPGAKALTVTSSDAEILCTAFKHPIEKSFTAVIINSGAGEKTLDLSGTGIPSQMTKYQSTSTESCANKGTVSLTGITLPARSVVTLYLPPTVSIKDRGLYNARTFNVKSNAIQREYSINGRLLLSQKSTPGLVLKASNKNVRPLLSVK